MNITYQVDKYIPIDHTDSRFSEYENIFINCSNLSSHSIIFHGESGCGKTMFRNRCISALLNKWNDDIVCIDLHDYLRDSRKSSPEKVSELVEAIIYEITKIPSYSTQDFPSGNDNLRIRAINSLFQGIKKFLVIIFPPIKIWGELEKFFTMFSSVSTILVFETDSEDIVKNIKQILPQKITCYKINNLKAGDGKLFLSTYYNSDPDISFVEEDIESSITKQIPGCGMTISQLKKLCMIVYDYAKKENINIITKREMFDAFIQNCHW